MTTQAQQNFLIKTLSRGCMASLREVVEQCDDRDTARPIYTELIRLATKLSEKHDFAFHKRVKGEEMAVLG